MSGFNSHLGTHERLSKQIGRLTMKFQLKQQLKQYIKDHYDYIEALDIAKINRDHGYGCTIKQCVEIKRELYGSR